MTCQETYTLTPTLADITSHVSRNCQSLPRAQGTEMGVRQSLRSIFYRPVGGEGKVLSLSENTVSFSTCLYIYVSKIKTVDKSLSFKVSISGYRNYRWVISYLYLLFSVTYKALILLFKDYESHKKWKPRDLLNKKHIQTEFSFLKLLQMIKSSQETVAQQWKLPCFLFFSLKYLTRLNRLCYLWNF